jgi:hypothetical protein
MRRTILARKDIERKFLASLGGPQSAPEGPRGPKVPMEGISGATEGLTVVYLVIVCLKCVCVKRRRTYLNSSFASGSDGLSTGSSLVASPDRTSGLQ